MESNKYHTVTVLGVYNKQITYIKYKQYISISVTPVPISLILRQTSIAQKHQYKYLFLVVKTA